MGTCVSGDRAVYVTHSASNGSISTCWIKMRPARYRAMKFGASGDRSIMVVIYFTVLYVHTCMLQIST